MLRSNTPLQPERFERQRSLGVDNGMRLKLTWEGGFTTTVHSWEAAAAITGRSKHTLAVYYSAGRLIDGLACRNPATHNQEICMFEVERQGKRGAKPDPNTKAKRKAELEAKITKAKAKVAELEKQRETL